MRAYAYHNERFREWEQKVVLKLKAMTLPFYGQKLCNVRKNV